jgi:hypothetical protein
MIFVPCHADKISVHRQEGRRRKIKYSGYGTTRYEHTASINCLISDSVILVPSFGKPALSSSRVIVPLLSVSRDLNISLKPTISSSDKLSATI